MSYHILDIRGKKIVFIDEISFGFPLDMRPETHQDNDVHPGFQVNFSFPKRKPEKLGERIAY